MTMKYSIYKKYFKKYPSREYNSEKKTIEVDLPEHKTIKWPSNWKKSGNSLRTPSGIEVLFWNSGLTENFYVSCFVSQYCQFTRTISPAIDARQQVIDTVAEFEFKSQKEKREII